jgi:pimeloyl-ACP methyl ester carboxylesterase
MQTKKEQLKFSEMGAGQPLVFISGLSVDKSIWDGVLSVIKNDFHIIYFDNKGVGDNSNFSSPLTTLDMAKSKHCRPFSW